MSFTSNKHRNAGERFWDINLIWVQVSVLTIPICISPFISYWYGYQHWLMLLIRSHTDTGILLHIILILIPNMLSRFCSSNINVNNFKLPTNHLRNNGSSYLPKRVVSLSYSYVPILYGFGLKIGKPSWYPELFFYIFNIADGFNRHEKRQVLRDPGLWKYLKIVEEFTKNTKIIFILIFRTVETQLYLEHLVQAK